MGNMIMQRRKSAIIRKTLETSSFEYSLSCKCYEAQPQIRKLNTVKIDKETHRGDNKLLPQRVKLLQIVSIRKRALCLNELKFNLSSLICYLNGILSGFKLFKLKILKCTFF